MPTSPDTQRIGRPLRLLLVEDNDADARLALEIFRDQLPPHALQRASDGEEALRIMQDGGFDAVILDLNLPKMDGMEVLRAMRADPALAAIPVVVLTSSEQEVERLGETSRVRLPQAGDRFLVKPVDIDEFEREVSLLRPFFDSLCP